MAERHEHKIFLTTFPASREQRRLALLVLGGLVFAFALLAPFARARITPISYILPAAILPAYQAARLVAELITAGLLFALYAADRSRAVLVLAAGYLFSALTVIPPYALAVAELFAPAVHSFNGLRGSGWIFGVWHIVWHVVFAFAVLAYALLKDDKSELTHPVRGSAAVILGSIAIVAFAIVVIAWLIIVGHPILGPLMSGPDAIGRLWHPAFGFIPGLNLLVLIVLWARQRSLLDLCLMVVLGCLTLGSGLSMVMSHTELSLGYYAGRVYELMGASFVLLVMLVEAMALYGRLVQVNTRLLGILEAIPEGLAIYDSRDRLRHYNSRYRDLFPELANVVVPGIRFEDLASAGKERGLYKNYGDDEENFIAKRVAQHRSAAAVMEQQLSDGRWLQIRERKTPDGSTVGVWTDISDIKRREEALRESEQRYWVLNSHLLNLLETIPEGIAIFDADDRLAICNDKYRDLFPKVGDMIVPGLRFEDLVRANLAHASFKLSEAEEKTFLAERMAQHRSPESLTELHLADDRWIQVHKRHAPDGSIIGVWTDVSEMKRREEALRESKRVNEMQAMLFHLSRVSELAQIVSSLIHEVSQPLAAIGNYLSGLQRLVKMGKLEAVGPPLELAAAQAARASGIVHRLRDFVVKRETEKKRESLPQMIEDAVALSLVGAVGHEVKVSLRFDPQATEAFIDRVQIEQVLFNLVRNAAEAMAGMPRRELVISTTRLDNDRIEICVADTGPGLPALVREKLFEPFVTTKESGMGIGLSVCRVAVEGHGGRLEAENDADGGATFRFSVPASGGARAETKEIRSASGGGVSSGVLPSGS